ncbi:MAG TPA: type II toxin-antitoxin system antitoxin, RelB/DinJ family [Candidatus Yonathbacteria bacterium]|nr:type II toxin-antitoxin system antitoxin, RelB/DinJ family [Candidatus Yonathbacteria bacterium]
MNTTLQIRVDKKLKDDATKVFKSMGLTLSGGVKLYLAYVVNTGTIPFEITTLNNTPKSKKKATK